jgi:hypothetical protein
VTEYCALLDEQSDSYFCREDLEKFILTFRIREKVVTELPAKVKAEIAEWEKPFKQIHQNEFFDKHTFSIDFVKGSEGI